MLVTEVLHMTVLHMASIQSNPDFWEEQYIEIYNKWQQYQAKVEQDLNHIEKRCKIAEDITQEEKVKSQTLEKCMSSLKEEMKELVKREEHYMKERTKLMSCISTLEKNLKHSNEQNKKKEDENKRVRDSYKESLQRLRNTLSEKTEDIHKLEETVSRQRQENQELKDTLSDIRNQVESKNIKVLNKYDELFARYISLFSNDEEAIRHRFQDKTTQGSNFAFKMLIQTCHDDVTKEVKHLKYLVTSVDSMVEAVLYHKIEIKMCMYARTIQYRYSTLFDDASNAQAKTKDLTKYKIKFEQVDLNNARANFVVALLEAMQSVPGDESTSISSKQCFVENVLSDCCEKDTGYKKQKTESNINRACGFE